MWQSQVKRQRLGKKNNFFKQSNYNIIFSRHHYYISVCLYQSTFYLLSHFNMNRFVEQRIYLKFRVTNEISGAEALKMLQKGFWRACSVENLGIRVDFISYRKVLEDLLRSGHSSTSIHTNENVKKVKEIIISA